MKRFKKLLGVLLAGAMAIGMMAMPAAAADTTISVAAGDSHTYNVYQIFTGTYDDTSNTLADIKWGQNSMGATGTAVSADIITALSGFAADATNNEKLDEILKYANTATTPIGTVDATTPLTVTTGYYLLKDQTIAENANDAYSTYMVAVAGPVTFTRKSAVPTVEKKVKDTTQAGGTSGWQDAADYDLGDSIPYMLTGTLPENFEDYRTYTTYTFTDTLSAGLTYNGDVKVYLDSENGKELTGSFTVETATQEDGSTIVTISLANGVDLKTITDNDGNAITDANTIVVRYSATLDSDAVVGAAGNPNTVKLTYSNNPNYGAPTPTPIPGQPTPSVTPAPEEPSTGDTPEDKVTVFTYQITPVKTDGTAALEGAEFTIYGSDGTTALGTGTSDAKGKIVFMTGEGENATELKLDQGTYVMKETVTPAGYNTAAPITITVTAGYDTTSDDPKLNTLTTSVEGYTTDVQSGIVTGTIVDTPASNLPSTGGVGRTMLYVTGILSVAVAGLYFGLKRRKRA
jgi:fimbrial isopeptide formation D2 family protein/LPXTG-motif cell wall-anchored protein